MSGKIIVLDDIEYLRENFPRIKEILLNEDAPVVPFSDAARLFLEKEGVPCLDYHDFEKKEKYADVYRTARQWAANWYKAGGADVTAAEGYSLGFLFEWVLIHYFVHLIRLRITAADVLRTLDPEKVIVICPEKADVASHIPRWKSVNAAVLPELVFSCVGGKDAKPEVNVIAIGAIPEKKSAPSKAVIMALARAVNTVASGVIGFMNKAVGKRKRILFFEGFRHFYGIMRSGDMADLDKIHLEKSLGPSIMFKLYAAGVRIESLDRDRPNEASGTKFPVDEAKSSLGGFFMFDSSDLFSVAWPRIEFLLTEFFPRVMCPHLTSVIRTLDAARPDCVVVENDNTYNEKMVVAVSARKGIKTVVVQNGAMWLGSSCGNPGISVHDFYPLIADNFMAFGEVNKEWYAKMGADPRKVIVTGAARFDHYYREKRSQEKVIGARRTVLVLLNDVGSEEGVVTQDMPLGEIKAHIHKYLELASRNPGIDIVVRPHHDEGLWRELFAAELAKAPNFVISRKGSLAELFGKVDAVVGYVSTALIEALIMRIPVISVDVDGKCAPFPLWEYGLSKRVSSFKELEPVLSELLYDSRKRSQFRGEIDKNIGLFNLKDDGNATGRVTLELREMLLETPLK